MITAGPPVAKAIAPPIRPGSDALFEHAVAEWDALAWVPRELLIDGTWRAASAGRRLAVTDPATGEALAEVADAEPADCLAALAAADRESAAWAAAAPRQRANVLRRAAGALRAEARRLAQLITLDAGKPLCEAREEVAHAAEYLEYYAEEAPRAAGRVQPAPEGDCLLVVRPRPLGPCLIITPWNFPLAIPARGLAPALAAGCPVVLRASDRAPLAALALARVLSEAGVPAGVLNVVVSSRPGATDGLLSDRRLRKLTMTGSSAMGRQLAARAAAGVARVGAELGGQAPFLVCADADLEDALAAGVLVKCRNAGQACTAANRFFVHESLAGEFAGRLAERLGALRLGRGTEEGVQMGPLINEAQRERLDALVSDAVAWGARVVLAGGPLPGPGCFFAPVVLSEVPAGARILDEEIFGPVAVVEVFADQEQALARANAAEHGLAGYVFGADLARALDLAGRLECGMVGVNRVELGCAAAPFGGVKASGAGRAGGPEGLAEYQSTSYLAVAGVA
jgi:succinate-semialdehyde dehydrogenase/glutarate-semialdehyde dehydrogenase